MDQDFAMRRLLPVVAVAFTRHRDGLRKLQESGLAQFRRPDMVWHLLLQSFATLGNSRGYEGLIENQANYRRLDFQRLAGMDAEAREKEVNEVCHLAKVRMPNKKTEWILSAFQRVTDMGGPEAAKEQLVSLETREEKLRFWKNFDGIGEKYSRNIMMDVHDEDFRAAIAVDVRISRISKALGLDFPRPYPDAEAFYLKVAKNAGMTGWELDRLLYTHGREVEELLTTNGGA